MYIKLNNVKLRIEIDGNEIDLRGNNIKIEIDSDSDEIIQVTSHNDYLDARRNTYLCLNNIKPNIESNIKQDIKPVSDQIEIWTDGSCINNHNTDLSTRKSGIGIHFSHTLPDISETIKEKYKTNTRAEMIAIFRAVQIANRKLKNPHHIVLYSDSEVTIHGLTIYKNNKKKSNIKLWDELFDVCKNTIHTYEFIHILRSSVPENDIADKLSKLAARGGVRV